MTDEEIWVEQRIFKFVERDKRGRIVLARIGKPEHIRYIVHVEPDGTIILQPGLIVRLDRVKP